MEYKYKWILGRKELWVYVCDRKKSGKIFRFKEASNVGEVFYPCDYCELSRKKCKSSRNPLYPGENDNDFSEFCATITIEDEEIQKLLASYGINNYRLVITV